MDDAGTEPARDALDLGPRAAAGRLAKVLCVLLATVLLAGGPISARAEDQPEVEARPSRPPTLRVFAAASLTEVVGALAKDFAGARVETSFGASSDLARQLADGAPADVFVSASPEWTSYLDEQDALVGRAVVFARNALVCIAPEAQGPGLEGARGEGSAAIADPKALLARLAPGDLVAIADPGVPAGEYARAALGRLGIAQPFERHLVGQRDVRAVLHAVEQGEVVAGFVYATDARLARVETLFEVDPRLHPEIVYSAVVLRQSGSRDLARSFVSHLGSERARARLRALGFSVP